MVSHARGAIPVKDDEGKFMYYGSLAVLTNEERAMVEEVYESGEKESDYVFGDQIHKEHCRLALKSDEEYRKLREDELRMEEIQAEKRREWEKNYKEYRIKVKEAEAVMEAEAAEDGAAVGEANITLYSVLDWEYLYLLI
jgi:hypothetical protein